ncbi:NUDIX hydrolase [Lunatimonas lonarensis]|nr:NUDIX hydrolase [Lunatimonas lonarensis]
MKIFINDKPLELCSPSELQTNRTFEVIYDKPEDLPHFTGLFDDVLIINPSREIIVKLLYLLRTRKLKKLDSITVVSGIKEELQEFIKSRFYIVKAAGGVVTKEDDKILFIHRLGKWDFPKGKFEKKETPEACAIREVEEECGLKVRLKAPIGKTWHTYTQNRKNILKKTYWYSMECVKDSEMAPQVEEGIDDIRWMTHQEAKIALVNSYPSMRYLYKRFLKSCPKVLQMS